MACGATHLAQPHGDGHRVRQKRHVACKLRSPQWTEKAQPPMERRKRTWDSVPIPLRQTDRPPACGKCGMRIWRIRYHSTILPKAITEWQKVRPNVAYATPSSIASKPPTATLLPLAYSSSGMGFPSNRLRAPGRQIAPYLHGYQEVKNAKSPSIKSIPISNPSPL